MVEGHFRTGATRATLTASVERGLPGRAWQKEASWVMVTTHPRSQSCSTFGDLTLVLKKSKAPYSKVDHFDP